MTLRERQSVFLIMDAKLVLKANELGTPIVCMSWIRTQQEQAMLVAKGASKKIDSKHLEGLAKDYCFLADLKDDGKINFDIEKYRALGEFWESIGGRWGGRFGDNPTTPQIEGWDAGHFEYIQKGDL